MFQRLQTIFLILIVLCMFTLFFVPIWHKVDPATGHAYKMHAWHLQAINPVDKEGQRILIPYIFIGIMASIVIMVALYVLFRYDKFTLQLQLGALNSLLMTGIIGLMVYLTRQDEARFIKHITGHYQIGFILAIIALIGNLLSNQLIKKDEQLMRSMGRIR